ncbi:MAG: helix-turn-helix domain-containing protein [Clostridium sp.]
MNPKFNDELPKILNLFYSIIKIPVTILLDDWSYYDNIGSTEDDINFLKTNKERYPIDILAKNNFTTISRSNKIFYAAKLINIQSFSNYIFIVGPISEKKFIELNEDKKLTTTDSLIYIFKLLLIIIEDKFNSLITKNLILDFHVSKAISIIHNNYENDLTIDSISSKLKLNKCYFCSLFKKETGLTFSKFLNLIRIAKSKELLTDKNNSILDVAVSVGFNNQNYYSIAFKSVEGITPSAYRKTLLY